MILAIMHDKAIMNHFYIQFLIMLWFDWLIDFITITSIKIMLQGLKTEWYFATVVNGKAQTNHSTYYNMIQCKNNII